jgi:hypothetical protein
MRIRDSRRDLPQPSMESRVFAARVIEQLLRRGDEVLDIAPSAVRANDLDTGDGVRVVRPLSFSVAGYSDIRLAVGGVSRVSHLADFAPDVHLASPFELGRRAMRAAGSTGHTNRGGVSNGCARVPRKVRSSVSEAYLAAGHRNPPVCNPCTRTISFCRAAAGTPRHPESNCGAAESTRRASPGKRSGIPREGAERRTTDRFVGRPPSRSRWKTSSRSPALISSCTPVNSRPLPNNSGGDGIRSAGGRDCAGGTADLFVDSSRTGWFAPPGDLAISATRHRSDRGRRETGCIR